MTFPNYAGRADVDDEVASELTQAGITAILMPEITRGWHPEMRTIVMGNLHGWSFKRAWRYWVCEGPGIQADAAEALHKTHGSVVRVHGDCTAPSPRDRLKGLAVNLYHVDSQEGLNALAATIRGLVEDRKPPLTKIMYRTMDSEPTIYITDQDGETLCAVDYDDGPDEVIETICEAIAKRLGISAEWEDDQ